METKIIKIEEENPKHDIDKIEIAGQIIREGGLVAFPTETVYGLGANALDADAVKKIYLAKGRPADNPMIVHIYESKEAYKYAADINDNAKKLMDAFFPGSLTVIVKKNESIPDIVTGGLDTVGLRCPINKVAHEFLKAASVAVAAPSANISGRPSPTTAKHVIDDMNGKIDAIIDGGDCSFGLESTVIDSTVVPPAILRPGKVTLEDIRTILPDAVYDEALVLDKEVKNPKSPGMKYKHYAPKAVVYIVEGDKIKVRERILSLLDQNKKTAVISVNGFSYDAFKVFDIGNDKQAFASRLFSVLRECDDLGIEVVYSEITNDSGIGFALKNRLYKAAGYQIIKV